MRVTVRGLSGLTNAYTSVLSAEGSLEISGASRCEDMAEPFTQLGMNRKASRRGRRCSGTRCASEGPSQSGDELLVGHDDFVTFDHEGDFALLQIVDVRGHGAIGVRWHRHLVRLGLRTGRWRGDHRRTR